MSFDSTRHNACSFMVCQSLHISTGLQRCRGCCAAASYSTAVQPLNPGPTYVLPAAADCCYQLQYSCTSCPARAFPCLFTKRL
jgi:hypothetical protein